MRLKVLLSSVAVLATVSGSPLLAQSADADTSGFNEEDIIVSARRRDERLLDVPVAVTALSGDQLQQRRIDNVEALTFVAPGLQIQATTWGKSVPGYAIRGQRALEAIINLDPAVGIYFAEQVQQRPHGTNSALYDLASVEVLKGPQGTLFGRNTTGGAILMNPNKPVFETEGMVQFDVGNYDLKRATAVVNLPLSDTLAIRAAGRITRRDGFVENSVGAAFTNPFQNQIRTGLGFKSATGSTAGTRSDDERSESARLSLLWRPSDVFTSYFVASYFHQNDNGTGFALVSVNPGVAFAANPVVTASFARQNTQDRFWTSESNFHPATKVKAWSISNTSTLELGSVTLKNIFGYRKVDAASLFDFDASPAASFESGNRLKASQWTEEFQVSGDLSDSVNFITGLYWFRETGRDTQLSILFGTRANDGSAKNESYSAYAQFGAKLTDKLTLTAGARYTIDERQMFVFNRLNGVCRLVDANNQPLNPCFKGFDKSYRSPSWLVSLDYKVNPDTLIYLAHRRGYRSGGWNLRANRLAEQVSFKPETVYDVELGTKTRLFDGALSINAAIYQQWYKNIQRSVLFIPVGGTPAQAISVAINAADAEIRGGELEVNLRPVPWLELGGSLSHVDASYKSFIQGVADYSNSRFAAVPKWTYTLTGRVYLPVGDSAGEVSLGASYYHQSGTELTDLNILTVNGVDTRVDQPIPGYGVVDASLDWKRVGGMPLDLAVFAKNLTKEKYYTGGSSVWATLGLAYAGYGNPRQFGASLTWHFGGSASR